MHIRERGYIRGRHLNERLRVAALAPSERLRAVRASLRRDSIKYGSSSSVRQERVAGIRRIAIGYREFDRPVPRNLRRAPRADASPAAPKGPRVPDRHVFRLNIQPSPPPGYDSGHLKFCKSSQRLL